MGIPSYRADGSRWSKNHMRENGSLLLRQVDSGKNMLNETRPGTTLLTTLLTTQVFCCSVVPPRSTRPPIAVDISDRGDMKVVGTWPVQVDFMVETNRSRHPVPKWLE